MNKKDFYEKQLNFSERTASEYNLSPGIKCKFDLLKEHIGSKKIFKNGIDLGCSGNSFIYFLNNINYKSFLDIVIRPLKQYELDIHQHPLCGDLSHLPYRNGSFDLVSALDVLEHVKNDELAVSEISRILKKSGIAIITVPHGMKYYTKQDKLIGHYRRYEINHLVPMFNKNNLIRLKTFGVYGQLMKITEIQSKNPEKIERGLTKLRTRYETNVIFRKFWNVIVEITSKMMKVDAKYHSLEKIMNIAFIFVKA